jgi:hypothetical protein
MAQDKKGRTQLRLARRPMRPKRRFYAPLRGFPPGSAARSIALGLNCELSPPDERKICHPLGPPMDIRQVAELIGCSLWTVRQTLLPSGLPYFRSGASGKLIFYKNQVTRWIERQQKIGGMYR